MAAIHSDEFKRDAVRIALISGLTRRQVASDLGVWHCTLGNWVRAFSKESMVPAQDAEFLRVRMTTESARPKRPMTTHKMGHSLISQPIHHIPVFVQRTVDHVQPDFCSAMWQENERGARAVLTPELFFRTVYGAALGRVGPVVLAGEVSHNPSLP